jgi:proteasome assembly chaperone (PAC2) family protein
MEADRVTIEAPPKLSDGRMVLAFTGWMDGGDVSTGTVEWLTSTLGARRVGAIDPEGFYISSFPGSMEISALFRPHTQIVDGEVRELREPANIFYSADKNRLLLFVGKEPNLNWRAFADRTLSFASQAGVRRMYFVGSYAGMVPHTREPRLMSAVSDPAMKAELAACGIRFTSYEGPASFATYLMTRAGRYGLAMASLVAEIPAYVQGPNPKCIEAVVRKLVAILGLHVRFDDLRSLTDAWEQRLGEALQDKQELRELIGKMEESYDNEVFDTQMGDLKEWLEQQGVRLD